MDYHEVMTKYLSKALETRYDIDKNDLLFKHINKGRIDVFFKGDLILGINYLIMEDMKTRRIVDVKITNYGNNSTKRNLLSLSKYYNYDLEFQNHIIKLLEESEFSFNKETAVVNNAQEIIEITKKAKEENIKKDIETIETKILEAAKDGNERLLFSLSELKTDVSLMNKYDNEIINHFKNKGFECSICDGNHLGRYLKISWGD